MVRSFCSGFFLCLFLVFDALIVLSFVFPFGCWTQEVSNYNFSFIVLANVVSHGSPFTMSFTAIQWAPQSPGQNHMHAFTLFLFITSAQFIFWQKAPVFFLHICYSIFKFFMLFYCILAVLAWANSILHHNQSFQGYHNICTCSMSWNINSSLPGVLHNDPVHSDCPFVWESVVCMGYEPTWPFFTCIAWFGSWSTRLSIAAAMFCLHWLWKYE